MWRKNFEFCWHQHNFLKYHKSNLFRREQEKLSSYRLILLNFANFPSYRQKILNSAQFERSRAQI